MNVELYIAAYKTVRGSELHFFSLSFWKIKTYASTEESAVLGLAESTSNPRCYTCGTRRSGERAIYKAVPIFLSYRTDGIPVKLFIMLISFCIAPNSQSKNSVTGRTLMC